MSFHTTQPSPQALLAGIDAVAKAIGRNCTMDMYIAMARAEAQSAPMESEGVELRDQFALAALPAIMSAAMENRARRKGGGAITEAWIAQYSYEIADAMLAARSAA